MKALNEKELAVFAGFAVLGAPDEISGETSVTLDERKALYRALRLDHFEVTKDEFAAVEALYDDGQVTIAVAAELLLKKKPAVQQKIYKAVYTSVKALAGGSEAKMARGDRKGSLDELKDKLGITDANLKSSHIHDKKENAHGESPKSSKMSLIIGFVVLIVVTAGTFYFLKMKH